MAVDSGGLKSWLLLHAQEIKLCVTVMNWPAKWAPVLADYQIELTINNETFTGRGISENENLAFIKAGAEALERAVMAGHSLMHSNGLAAHQKTELAAITAQLELVERDAFFCHYLTNTPFEIIPADVVGSELLVLRHTISQLQEKGIELLFGRMRTIEGLHAIVCACFGSKAQNHFGVILGLSCKFDLNEALHHAFLEALPNVVNQLESSALQLALTIEDFAKLKRHTAFDHLNLGLNQKAGELMKGLFHLHDSCPKKRQRDAPIEIEALTAKFLHGETLPMRFVRASSSKMQAAYFGMTTPEKVNLGRLIEFAGRTLSFEELQQTPHPLG